MAAFKIADLTEGKPDPAGVIVEEIYARRDDAADTGNYAIYRNTRRIMVLFDDEDVAKADKQRSDIAPMAALRGQIDAWVRDWSDSSDLHLQVQARCYQSRAARSLEVALEGGLPSATRLLEEIRDDIVANRTATARFQYLIAAAAVAGGAFLLIWIAALLMTGGICGAPLPAAQVLNGLIGGTIGAFFSIATGLRGRTVLPDFFVRDNVGDALLRMVIGTIAGGVIVSLFVSHVLTASILKDIEPDGTSLLQLVVFGFLAGFSERMVPDLLGKVGSGELRKDAAAEAANKAAK